MREIPTDDCIRRCSTMRTRRRSEPGFDQVFEQLPQRGGLKAFQRLGGRTQGGARWHPVFLFARAQLSAVPDARTIERQDGA
jgi:hypothetical protein